MGKWMLLMVVGLVSSGCGQRYGGANCHSIAIGTSISDLPTSSTEGVPASRHPLSYPEPFIAGNEDIACCTNAYFSFPSCNKTVDCAALQDSLRIFGLTGKYVNETCIGDGVAFGCSVYVDDSDKVVGVRTYCAN